MFSPEKHENNRVDANGYAARLDAAADTAVTATQEAAEQAGKKIEALTHNALSMGENGIDALSKLVGRNPMVAMGIAAGVGLLAGLMSRRDSR
jgi:ElaB/YqjD/DUF883 family membrane-anchored ribosome-binding protein